MLSSEISLSTTGPTGNPSRLPAQILIHTRGGVKERVPHLVRVPTRLLVLVKQVLLAKLPSVPIQHRTHPKRRVAAWRGAEHRGEGSPTTWLTPPSPPVPSFLSAP